MKEILSDDKKLQKSREEAEKASKEKASAPSTSDQQSSLGEGSGSVSKEFDHQEPGNEEGEELAVKEVSFAKLNTKDKALMKALSEARDLCYQQDNLSVQYVQGAIMNISSTPTAAQIHYRKLFKLGPPGNCVMDDIHSHWESYLYDFGALANAPYSQFHPKEGWDAVYTWESLKKHEPTFANSFRKKANKPSLIVVVAPTTTEIGDDYFLSKLHKAACIKQKLVYFSPKVSGKRSCIQVVICPYCGVLSQNAPSGCSHIQRHLGLMFACGACRPSPRPSWQM